MLQPQIHNGDVNLLTAVNMSDGSVCKSDKELLVGWYRHYKQPLNQPHNDACLQLNVKPLQLSSQLMSASTSHY